MTNNEQIERAKELYRQGKKLVDIAAELGRPEGTIRRWKSTYGWDGERSKKGSERSVKKSERSLLQELQRFLILTSMLILITLQLILILFHL